jgi:hypothetical protein
VPVDETLDSRVLHSQTYFTIDTEAFELRRIVFLQMEAGDLLN